LQNFEAYQTNVKRYRFVYLGGLPVVVFPKCLPNLSHKSNNCYLYKMCSVQAEMDAGWSASRGIRDWVVLHRHCKIYWRSYTLVCMLATSTASMSTGVIAQHLLTVRAHNPMGVTSYPRTSGMSPPTWTWPLRVLVMTT